MVKTYAFAEEPIQEDPKHRPILVTETVTEEREERFSIHQKEQSLEGAKQAVLDAQKRVDDLEKEIVDIKTALEIA